MNAVKQVINLLCGKKKKTSKKEEAKFVKITKNGEDKIYEIHPKFENMTVCGKEFFLEGPIEVPLEIKRRLDRDWDESRKFYPHHS